MKKQLFFIATAALVLASCSQDETIEVNTSEAISFRTFVNAQTRAVDITTANIADFNVTAMNGDNTYFDNVTFTRDANNTFNSATSYYWPANDALDFYAYSPISNDQVTKTDYKTFTVTPAATPADQVDFVYANTDGKIKATSANGVELNFRHTGSKIVFQVKNTAANMKFEVKGWKVGYLDNEGTFTYGDDSTTDGQGTLADTYWSNNGDPSADNTYTNTLSAAVSVNASASTAAKLDGEMILVPQQTTAATTYAAAAADSKVNGSYVALEIKIMNNDNAGTVIQENTWAIWPVAFSWEPGKKYTYTIDLAGGGYYETNVDGSETDDTELDPILEDAIIKFVDVTVDEWTAVDPTEVTMPVPEP